MRFLRRRLAGALGAALLVPAGLLAQAQKAPQHPRLIVLLVVDQMRADYVDQFQQQWSSGLRRLIDHGGWFRQAAYPYANTFTCVGHATISTGNFPATHGIIGNVWWDRQANRMTTCTSDPQANPVSYGEAAKAGESAWRLEVPTLADALRAQLGVPPRVVTFSLKARAAIMLAGHRADAVTWLDNRAGAWVTSSAFSAAPVPFVADFVKTHPLADDFGKSWTLTLPEREYVHPASEVGEVPLPGWTTTFPHKLVGASGKPDSTFYEHWEASPFSDAYLGRMAEAAVDALQLGRGPGTDYLAVSFSALDLVGHRYGPRSHEIQDVLVRLDRTIGGLLAHLDRAVGANNYAIVLTADHGVAPIPEQLTQQGFDAGRLRTSEIVAVLENALAAKLGPGPYVAGMVEGDVWFLPSAADKLKGNPEALQAAMDAVSKLAGVGRVFRGEELRPGTHHRALGQRLAGAAALSYFSGRSGDLVVVAKAYWPFETAPKGAAPSLGTTHGSPYLYDQRVPILLMGRGIKPGQYFEPATPADIAPTLALLVGVTLPETDGRVLAEALAVAPAGRRAPRSAAKP